jgi:hypothetical protein
MECRISISARDQGTELIADALDPCLETLSLALSKDYGDFLEHLWIDLDLCPAHADDRSVWPFRFQRVVSPRGLRGLGPIKYHNVGHYSVMPDYVHLANIPGDHVTCYLLSVIYQSTNFLTDKFRRLGDFDAELFRSEFRRAVAPWLCAEHSLA